MSKNRKHGPLTQWLRAKIEESDLSQNKLSRASGLSQSQISRFMSKHDRMFQSIRLGNADKLVNALQANVHEVIKAKADQLAKLTATVERMREEIEYWKGERDKLQEVLAEALKAKLKMDDAKRAMDVVVKFIKSIESKIEVPEED